MTSKLNDPKSTEGSVFDQKIDDGPTRQGYILERGLLTKDQFVYMKLAYYTIFTDSRAATYLN